MSSPFPPTYLTQQGSLAVVFKSFDVFFFLSFSFPKKLDQNFLLEKKPTCCWQRVSEPLNVPSIFVHVKLMFDTVRFQDQASANRQAGEVFSSLESRGSFPPRSFAWVSPRKGGFAQSIFSAASCCLESHELPSRLLSPCTVHRESVFPSVTGV